jgi:hypothetical protein
MRGCTLAAMTRSASFRTGVKDVRTDPAAVSEFLGGLKKMASCIGIATFCTPDNVCVYCGSALTRDSVPESVSCWRGIRRGCQWSSDSRPVMRQKVQHRLTKGLRVLPRSTVSCLRNHRLFRVRQEACKLLVDELMNLDGMFPGDNQYRDRGLSISGTENWEVPGRGV